MIDEYIEPKTALQDNDWKLPEPVELTFYAAYNLLEQINGEKSTPDNDLVYISINQSIDAILQSKIMNIEEVNEMLSGFNGTQQ